MYHIFPKNTHIFFKQNPAKKMGPGEILGKQFFCYLVQKKNLSSEAVGELLELFVSTHGNSKSFGGCGDLQCSTHSYRDPGVLQAGSAGWLGRMDGRNRFDMFLKCPSPKNRISKIEKHGGQTADSMFGFKEHGCFQK